MHQPQPGRPGELDDGQRPVPRGRVRAGLERQHLHRDRAAVGGGLGQRRQLLVHHLRAADLLVQRRLPDDQAHLRAGCSPRIALLAGQDRLGRPVPGGVVVQGRVGLRQRPGVGAGLQQRRGPAGPRTPLIFDGGRLEDQVVPQRAGQDVVVVAEPAEGAARVGQLGQQGLLLAGDAVLAQELAQLLGADAALAGLDPAELRRGRTPAAAAASCRV